MAWASHKSGMLSSPGRKIRTQNNHCTFETRCCSQSRISVREHVQFILQSVCQCYLHNLRHVSSLLLLGGLALRCLKTLRHEVDPPDVVAVGVVLDGGHCSLQVLVTHGDLLDGVPAAALLHLHDLPVLGELVGDLLHPGHPDVGEVDGEVPVLVRHNPLGWCW